MREKAKLGIFEGGKFVRETAYNEGRESAENISASRGRGIAKIFVVAR